jgi:hypothetical protein
VLGRITYDLLKFAIYGSGSVENGFPSEQWVKVSMFSIEGLVPLPVVESLPYPGHLHTSSKEDMEKWMHVVRNFDRLFNMSFVAGVGWNRHKDIEYSESHKNCIW